MIAKITITIDELDPTSKAIIEIDLPELDSPNTLTKIRGAVKLALDRIEEAGIQVN